MSSFEELSDRITAAERYWFRRGLEDFLDGQEQRPPEGDYFDDYLDGWYSGEGTNVGTPE